NPDGGGRRSRARLRRRQGRAEQRGPRGSFTAHTSRRAVRFAGGRRRHRREAPGRSLRGLRAERPGSDGAAGGAQGGPVRGARGRGGGGGFCSGRSIATARAAASTAS